MHNFSGFHYKSDFMDLSISHLVEDLDLLTMSTKHSKLNNAETDVLADILIHQKKSSLSLKERLNFLYPMIDDHSKELPTKLSITEKSILADIDSTNAFRVNYLSELVTSEMGDNNNGCVRSENPIPLTSGIYYFEMKVLRKGRHKRTYIGLTSPEYNLHRAPGWDIDGYGYHGDDGKIFSGTNPSGMGQPYGPTFSTNDIVGCGINFENQTCFFTLNGNYLGVAFRNMPVSNNLYPTVGVGSDNDSVEVNFGQFPFMYDIKMEQLLHSAHSLDLKMARKHSIKRKFR